MKPKTQKCPCCGTEFIPKRSNQIYMNPKHKDAFFNLKKQKENKEKFPFEKQLRSNAKILEATLTNRFYKNNRIERRFLEFQGFDLGTHNNIQDIPKANKHSFIFWSHQYGVEVVGAEIFENNYVEYITIHYDKNFNYYGK